MTGYSINMTNKKILKTKIVTSIGRDDFTPKIKETLKKRAAFICSNPKCKKMCVSASEVDENKVMYIGEASHICAASSGGPRFDDQMTTDQRKDISNAIFLCSGCANMIDNNNGLDFTKETLQEWKSTHESWIISNLNKSILENLEAVPLDIELNQEFNGNTYNPQTIIIKDGGIANVNTKPFNPVISDKEETLNQPKVDILNSNQSFICAEIKRLSESKKEIFDPRSDYNNALSLLSLGDCNNSATLLLRIYLRINNYFQVSDFILNKQQDLADLEENIRKMESLHNGEYIEGGVSVILSIIEKIVRNLLSTLKI